eukprot:6211544-Pyramimonas_sp.AAC.1
MKQVQWLGQPRQNEDDDYIIFVLRSVQLRIDDDDARCKMFVRRPDADAPDSDFPWNKVLAIRGIGGQSCARVTHLGTCDGSDYPRQTS